MNQGGAIALAALVAVLAGCQRPPSRPGAGPGPAPAPAVKESLEIREVAPGAGPEALPGKTVSVHFTGWLLDGTKFDSSRDRGKPVEFVLGAGIVIPGWEEGIRGMHVGGKRNLRVPPHLAYGDRGGPSIPGGSTLVFDIELVQVR